VDLFQYLQFIYLSKLTDKYKHLQMSIFVALVLTSGHPTPMHLSRNSPLPCFYFPTLGESSRNGVFLSLLPEPQELSFQTFPVTVTETIPRFSL